MTASEWFIKLPYEKFNILIPQRYIINEEGIKRQNISRFHQIDFDSLIIKKLKLTYFEHGKVTTLFLSHKDNYIITTQALVQLVKLPLESLKPVTGAIKNKCLGRGMIAFSFEDKKINCVISPYDFFKRTREVNVEKNRI